MDNIPKAHNKHDSCSDTSCFIHLHLPSLFCPINYCLSITKRSALFLAFWIFPLPVTASQRMPQSQKIFIHHCVTVFYLISFWIQNRTILVILATTDLLSVYLHCMHRCFNPRPAYLRVSLMKCIVLLPELSFSLLKPADWIKKENNDSHDQTSQRFTDKEGL